MIGIAQPEYGSLAPLVKVVGWLVSASVAIGLSWRGRAKWEPVEEDVARGQAKVAGLLTAVGIAVIWSRLANPSHVDLITRMAMWFAAGAVLALLIYGLFISMWVYQRQVLNPQNEVIEEKIIGGFALTAQARAVRRRQKTKQPVTVQELFAGAAYDPDKLWHRPVRAFSKLCFAICYMCLVVCGSIGISCAAILLLLSAPQIAKTDTGLQTADSSAIVRQR